MPHPVSDFKADGLRLEARPGPSEALSDGAQSLKPARVAAIMKELVPLLELSGKSLHADASVGAGVK